MNRIEIEEHSHAALANAYDAGAANLPFAVFRGYIGVDQPEVNPTIRSVECPYTGERLATVPAIRPDVAIIHALRADRDGNVLIEGILGVQREAVLAAKRIARDRATFLAWMKEHVLDRVSEGRAYRARGAVCTVAT